LSKRSVATLKSVTRAAEKLSLRSHGDVPDCIALEDELGVMLLDWRDASSGLAGLLSPGMRFFSHAQRLRFW
jgi:DNA-binding transcriptional LysR family regulator